MAENNILSPTQETKGGLKYEVVLQNPSSDTPPKIVRPLQSPVKQLSVEDIENKLKVAEERRKTLEAQKINNAKERLSHVIELRGKRIEEEVTKIETTRQSLEKKMESFKENRETHIKAIQEKQKEHVIKVEAKRKLSLESCLPAKEKLDSIQMKIASAAESRDAKFAALQERLRDHDKHVADVRKQMEDTQESNELKIKLEAKLKHAQENRDLIVKEIQERQKEHGTKVAEVVKRKGVIGCAGDSLE